MKSFFLCIALFCGTLPSLLAQQKDSTNLKDEEEAAEPANKTDLSQFQGDMEEAGGTKRYCTSKVFGISPAKLISIGYDYQAAYKLTTSDNKTQSINSTRGIRFLANFPVISKNKIIVNVGTTYSESNYELSKPNLENPLVSSLSNNALRSTALNFTVFKPLNAKNFLLFVSQHELNGDYKLNEFQPIGYMKHSLAAVYGWKKNDRLQYGFGIARTYRVGELNYIPVVLYNYTSENRNWGIEAFFPARVHYRRSFNPRNLLLLGYELEGGSYRLQNRSGEFNTPTQINNDVELRRSELRFRAVYERQISGFVWLSVQVGYRYNYNFNLDNGEFFRGSFGKQLYLSENDLTNPLYFNISINLVSP